MEFVSGIRIRDILLDNGNWWKFFLKNRSLIRKSILVNVLKVLICRTIFLGYHLYACLTCRTQKKVPHSCKSRFCSSCGKKATDNWIQTSYNTLPETTWQHITFTMPSAFWDFFWINRSLLNKIPALAADIIKKMAKQKGFLPGIFVALHTFGRDLKRNVHIHLSTTVGGLAPDEKSWIASAYFYHDTIKKMWRHEIINLFRSEYTKGTLKLPPSLKHIKTYAAFNAWLDSHYQKTWVVHLAKQSDNMKNNVEYLGKYLKRPPLGETRIKSYDGKTVTFEYLDHHTDTTEIMTLPVMEFLARLIAHIPDRYFRNIRYYGFLATRVRAKKLPLVYQLLKIAKDATKKIYTSWKDMIKNTFGSDPLQCRKCGVTMVLNNIVFPTQGSLLFQHKEIAHAQYPLLQ